MKVRTRFAPSPTGYMHVGGVRTALFAWLTAKHNGGEFILRIEDTDRGRQVADSENHIIDTLQWLGLTPDEGPYRQSDRLDIYKDYAKRLINSGRAYADPYSLEELNSFRDKAKLQKKPFLFRDFRPASPPAWQPGLPLRFRSEPKQYQWQDQVMGRLSSGPEAVDDFILLKADGYPTYNFAHIVDDHLMGITHVIRSQEFLPSVPKFLNLYEALGLQRPQLATLPYVLGPDGHKKLSKRDGAKDILDYKREGYLPDALISFLATLGWNDGTEQEIFSRAELIEKFSLKRVHKSGAKLDEQRLLWTNGYFIRSMKLDELYPLTAGFWPAGADDSDGSYKKSVLGAVQERLKYLGELPGLTNFFFDEPDITRVKELIMEPVDKQLKKTGLHDRIRLLKKVAAGIEAINFTPKELENWLNGLLQSEDTTPGVLFALIRIAVSGSKSSPQIFDTLAVLGKEASCRRVKQAVQSLAD